MLVAGSTALRGDDGRRPIVSLLIPAVLTGGAAAALQLVPPGLALIPAVVGLTLLSQPAISAFVGWMAYGETLSFLDWVGAVAIGAALVLVRLPERGLPAPQEQPS